ncbi:MAG: beta-hydroxyacyl-ACP dehydratase [Planctomycetes bacterium]|nr:beta-hydroxyacyl-ACP dehydratase [Planctomycetota bacterium]
MSDERVKSAIPHREPFLFADRIVEQSDARIVTERLIRAEEPQFKGHYPEFPLMPGVLLCEACFQAGAILLGSRVASPESRVNGGEVGTGHETRDARPVYPMVTRIQDAKFRNPVFPGETIRIEVNLDEKMGNAYLMTGKVTSADKKVLTVQFIVAMVEKAKT